MVSSSGVLTPRRAMVMVTSVSFGPLSFITASSSGMLSVGSPSMLVMMSPARMPMREAGVPSSGEMTVSLSSRMPTRMPSPKKLDCWRSRMRA